MSTLPEKERSQEITQQFLEFIAYGPIKEQSFGFPRPRNMEMRVFARKLLRHLPSKWDIKEL